MEIQKRMENGILIVTLNGRMDAEGTRKFQEASQTWQTAPVILDLSRLDYICSSALRELLHMKRTAEKNGEMMVLSGSSGLVDRIIEVSGFDTIFQRFLSVPDALGACAVRAGPTK